MGAAGRNKISTNLTLRMKEHVPMVIGEHLGTFGCSFRRYRIEVTWIEAGTCDYRNISVNIVG